MGTIPTCEKCAGESQLIDGNVTKLESFEIPGVMDGCVPTAIYVGDKIKL